MPFPAAFQLPPHATLALACSGGADSVYLAHALHEFLKIHSFPPPLLPSSPPPASSASDLKSEISNLKFASCLLLHANHQLRGPESEADQAFVENLSQQFGWPLITERLPVPANPSEANLRDLRHDYFRRALAPFPRPVVLLFGHQLDDAAESVLMRLLRGSSAAGLAAPRACHEVAPGWFHVRPLLALRRADIRQTLADQKLPWRDDSSNSVPGPLRNQLRLKLLPTLAAAAGRDPAPALARARALAEEDDSALNLWLDQLLPSLKTSPNKESPASSASPASDLKSEISNLKSASSASPLHHSTLNLQPLTGLPAALWRRALERAIASFSPPPCLNARAKESLLSHLQAGTSTTISAGHLTFLQVSNHSLTLSHSLPASSLKSEISNLKSGSRSSGPSPASPFILHPSSFILSVSASLPSGWQLQLDTVPWPAPSIPASPASVLKSEISNLKSASSASPFILSQPSTIHLSPELAQPLQVRTWQAGDRFRPFRHPGTPKLQDLFVNRHIPRNLRTLLPVVTLADGSIVAVAGLPPGHDARVPENSTTALRLTFTPPITT